MTARGGRAEESGAKLLLLTWICGHEEDTYPRNVPQFPHPFNGDNKSTFPVEL